MAGARAAGAAATAANASASAGAVAVGVEGRANSAADAAGSVSEGGYSPLPSLQAAASDSVTPPPGPRRRPQDDSLTYSAGGRNMGRGEGSTPPRSGDGERARRASSAASTAGSSAGSAAGSAAGSSATSPADARKSTLQARLARITGSPTASGGSDSAGTSPPPVPVLPAAIAAGNAAGDSRLAAARHSNRRGGNGGGGSGGVGSQAAAGEGDDDISPLVAAVSVTGSSGSGGPRTSNDRRTGDAGEFSSSAPAVGGADAVGVTEGPPKQGVLFKKRDIFPGWRPRTFVLDRSQWLLRYYLPSSARPRGNIPMEGCSVEVAASAIDGNGGELCFCFVCEFVASYGKSNR